MTRTTTKKVRRQKRTEGVKVDGNPSIKSLSWKRQLNTFGGDGQVLISGIFLYYCF